MLFYRFQYQVLKPGKSKTLLGQIGLHLPFIIILSIQLLMAYFFWLAYGTLAFLLGPLRTWSVIIALVLWHQALILPEKCTRYFIKHLIRINMVIFLNIYREAAKIWSDKVEPEINRDSINLNSHPVMTTS